MFMIKCFSVKIMLFQFYLLKWPQTAETLEDQLTVLGQNVTINCDLNEEVYWLFLKLPDPPVVILRTMPSVPFYNSEKFRPKYSVLSKYHLFIYNVTNDKLGVYYCMNTDTKSRKFSNGTRLHIVDPTPESKNDTVVKCNEQNTQWLVIMSGLMNGVLIIVVIGLIKVVACGSKRSGQNSKTAQDDLQPQDSAQSQYAEVNYTTERNPIPLNGIYALIQLPK